MDKPEIHFLKSTHGVLWLVLLLSIGSILFAGPAIGKPMNENYFWELVEKSRGAGGEQKHTNRLVAQLKKLAPHQIIEFYELFERFHNQAELGDVWAAGMLLNGGHGTDDGFIYFRNWLIAQGRTVYERALTEPDSLASVAVEETEDGSPTAEWESYGYAAIDAYEALTDKDFYSELEKRESKNKPSRPSKEVGFDWPMYTDELLAQRLPKLWAKYGVFKQQFDEMLSQPHPMLEKILDNPEILNVESVFIPNLGTIAVGDHLWHQTYGEGTVKSLTQFDVVSAIVEFSDGERPMLLEGDSGIWSLVK